MFGKPLEDFVGQVRKFQMDEVTWEYTVMEIAHNRAVVQMICRGPQAQLEPVILIWDRGELSEHGFN